MKYKSEDEIKREFDELLKIVPNDNYGNLIKEAHKKGMTSDQMEFFLDRSKNSDLIIEKIKSFNLLFYENCVQIYNDEANSSNFSMFFIQIWILCSELLQYFEKSILNAKSLGQLVGISQKYIDLTQDCHAAILEVKEVLSEDDLLTIEFLRINFSHLQSSKYVIDHNLKSKTFGKEIYGQYRPDVRKKIQSILDSHGSNYSQYAKALTVLINKPISRAHSLIDEWILENFQN